MRGRRGQYPGFIVLALFVLLMVAAGCLLWDGPESMDPTNIRACKVDSDCQKSKCISSEKIIKYLCKETGVYTDSGKCVAEVLSCEPPTECVEAPQGAICNEVIVDLLQPIIADGPVAEVPTGKVQIHFSCAENTAEVDETGENSYPPPANAYSCGTDCSEGYQCETSTCTCVPLSTTSTDSTTTTTTLGTEVEDIIFIPNYENPAYDYDYEVLAAMSSEQILGLGNTIRVPAYQPYSEYPDKKMHIFPFPKTQFKEFEGGYREDSMRNGAYCVGIFYRGKVSHDNQGLDINMFWVSEPGESSGVCWFGGTGIDSDGVLVASPNLIVEWLSDYSSKN